MVQYSATGPIAMVHETGGTTHVHPDHRPVGRDNLTADDAACVALAETIGKRAFGVGGGGGSIPSGGNWPSTAASPSCDP